MQLASCQHNGSPQRKLWVVSNPRPAKPLKGGQKSNQSAVECYHAGPLHGLGLHANLIPYSLRCGLIIFRQLRWLICAEPTLNRISSFSDQSNLLRHANYLHSKGETHAAQPPTFRAEQAAKQTIEGADVDVVFRSWSDSRQSHQQSPCQNRREETYVCITGALNHQIRVLQFFIQFRQGIASSMMADIVLNAPQKHERRHEQ